MARLALGTAQFGLNYGISNTSGQLSISDVETILEYANTHDIQLLDTATVYGNSEEVIGDVLSNHSELSFNIVTKIPDCDVAEIDSIVIASLEKLKISTIYAVLFHNYSHLAKNYSKWNTLEEMRAAGKIKKIGVSLYHPSEWHDLQSRGIVPDIVQLPLNIFDQRFIPILKDMKIHHIEIHVRSVFLQGLLFLSPEELDGYFSPIEDRLIALRECSDKYSLPISTLCMQFANSYSEIDYLIIGVDDIAHLKKNLEALNNTAGFTSEVSSILEKIKIEDERMLLPYLWPDNSKRNRAI